MDAMRKQMEYEHWPAETKRLASDLNCGSDPGQYNFVELRLMVRKWATVDSDMVTKVVWGLTTKHAHSYVAKHRAHLPEATQFMKRMIHRTRDEALAEETARHRKGYPRKAGHTLPLREVMKAFADATLGPRALRAHKPADGGGPDAQPAPPA